jgi:hypothetical protein
MHAGRCVRRSLPLVPPPTYSPRHAKFALHIFTAKRACDQQRRMRRPFSPENKKKSSWAVHVRDRPRDGRCPAPRRWRRQSARRGSQPNGVGILPRNVYQEAELESTPSTVVLTVRAGRLANTAGEGEENWHTLSTCSPKRGKQILTRTAETPPPYRRRHQLDGHRPERTEKALLIGSRQPFTPYGVRRAAATN